ncbi:hypothetical protein BGW38_000187 [Lunasporangiospora selenospora]|uniref:RING-type E3 ubiquitin transferase n=1 Tax=Lunasporangiospora selenospora TaxID=979761 RepID=A0A9P6KEE1_9FUNG|nr:hypothetical protein BGW38_000187 [Lunasporangiospora selenospora]
MDNHSEAAPSSSSASTPAASRDDSGRSKGSGNQTRRSGPRSGQQQGQKSRSSESKAKTPSGSSSHGNNNNNTSNNSNNNHQHRHHHHRKPKSAESQEATTATPTNARIPRTIAATDPINLHPEGTEPASDLAAKPSEAAEDPGEQHSCFICTEDVVIFAVSDCNHRTCHLCLLRLRALYKTKNCAYCKADQGIVLFTRDPEKPFEDYDLKSMAYFDRKLNLYFEDQEMYEDTMVLLRFNCPDPTCEVACPDGWNQLKSHVKKVHKLLLCDLCVRHKKVFAHEHNLMTAQQLMRHFKSGDAALTNQNSAEPSGFNGHPDCGFCRESFYGDDELFEHCKKSHEQCFLCLRRNVRHQYYNKYLDLEQHFHAEHYSCMDPECLEKKFVVFDSDLDLKAHEVEQHPNMAHGQRHRIRDARKIDISFSFNSPSESSGSRRGRGNRQGGRDHQRHAPPQESDASPSQPQLTPHQVQQIALQQQLALEQERRNNNESTDSVQKGVSNLNLEESSTSSPSPSPAPQSMLRTRPPVGFGSSLTESDPTPATASSSSTRTSTATPTAAARLAAGIHRTSSPRPSSSAVVSHSTSDWPAMSSVSATPAARPNASKPSANATPETIGTLTTQFRNSQIPGNQFVVSLFSLFGSDADKTGKIVQGLYEVMDSEAKRTELIRAWNDYKAVQNQFPTLESTVVSNPTMADLVTPSTRRVLVIKSSGPAVSSGTGSGSWASSSSSSTAQFRPSTGAGHGHRGGAVSSEQFPSLVSHSPLGSRPTLGLLPMQKSKSQSGHDDSANGWVSGWNNAFQEEPEEESSSGKKKKNKKKILFHVG